MTTATAEMGISYMAVYANREAEADAIAATQESAAMDARAEFKGVRSSGRWLLVVNAMGERMAEPEAYRGTRKQIEGALRHMPAGCTAIVSGEFTAMIDGERMPLDGSGWSIAVGCSQVGSAMRRAKALRYRHADQLSRWMKAWQAGQRPTEVTFGDYILDD